MTIRAARLVLIVTLLLAGLATPWRPAAAAFPAQPHVVVIMTDDLDVYTVETLLALGFMPNLERFVVSRGVRSRQSFVTNSLC